MATLFALLLLVSQTPSGAALTGSVVRFGTGQPIGRARILLTKVDGRLADSITTSARDDGSFIVENIPSGTYRVFTEHAGYVRAEYGQNGTNRPGTPITLTASSQARRITLTMIPEGVITGRVLDEYGAAVSRVYVRALKATYPQGERVMNTFSETQTNDLGEYRLYGLPPGFYFISAAPYTTSYILRDRYITPTAPCPDCRGEGSASRPLTNILNSGGFIDPLALNHQAFTSTFFPGTTNVAEAKPLEVRPGTTMSGIDLGVSYARGVHVSGHAIDGTTGEGSDLGGAAKCSGLPQVQRFTPVGTNSGFFEFSGILPGQTVVRCVTSRLGGAVSLEIGDSDVEDIRLVLNPLIAITGRVRIEGQSALFDDTQLSQLRVIVGADDVGTSVQPNGAFTTRGLVSGDYRLTLSGLPSNAYLKAATSGDTDVLNGPLHVGAANGNTVDLLVGLNAGSVDVVVIDENARAVAGAVVAIVPASPFRKRFDLYRSAVTDSAGHVRLNGIAPSDYKVFAWNDIEEHAWHDPDILQMFESQGEGVRVREASVTDIRLKVIQ